MIGIFLQISSNASHVGISNLHQYTNHHGDRLVRDRKKKNNSSHFFDCVSIAISVFQREKSDTKNLHPKENTHTYILSRKTHSLFKLPCTKYTKFTNTRHFSPIKQRMNAITPTPLLREISRSRIKVPITKRISAAQHFSKRWQFEKRVTLRASSSRVSMRSKFH